MGYRFPAEIQTDRVYVERMVMNRPLTLRTPRVNRISNRLPQQGFKEMLDEEILRKKQKKFQHVYNELTGTGKRIDRTI